MIFCPPLTLCRELRHCSMSIRSLSSSSSTISTAVITSGVPAWRHFSRVEISKELWERNDVSIRCTGCCIHTHSQCQSHTHTQHTHSVSHTNTHTQCQSHKHTHTHTHSVSHTQTCTHMHQVTQTYLMFHNHCFHLPASQPLLHHSEGVHHQWPHAGMRVSDDAGILLAGGVLGKPLYNEVI